MKPIDKIRELRRLMAKRGLDAWIVPSADPHQSEYVAEHWQARAWLSGFRGSAGTLVVTLSGAGLWTDPRYHMRAAAELAGSGIELFKLGLPGVPPYSEWLCQELAPGASAGIDGSLLPAAEAALLRAALGGSEIKLIYTQDLIDELWQDRPALPLNEITLLAETFAGESRNAKLGRIRAAMRQAGAHSHLLCALDDIAWTLNIRGSDIAYNPVAVCYAVVAEQKVYLFIQPEKVPPEVKSALEKDGVVLQPYPDIAAYLEGLTHGAIFIDPHKTSAWLRGLISPQCQVIEGQSLPYGMKTVKNTGELDGIRRAHVRDGAAVVRWLCWLEQHISEEHETEISAAEKLAAFRSQGENYRGLSFNTIAGYGANSAVGHYASDPATCPTLRARGIFLVDSGAQYLDGTTDITRTLSLGEVTEEERRVFTQVLRCHMRLATARFPQGTTGSQLDALAREPLWRQGWNCRHGIGHGVGCFLNVHEGPVRFNEVNTTPLQAGMLVSNEPGVYFEGRFGVRIENLMIVTPAGRTDFGEFLGFETVSLCPIDLALVEVDLLEAWELAWLNAYHQQVRESLAPLLDEREQAWLRQATQEI